MDTDAVSVSGALKSVGKTTYNALEIVVCVHGVLQTILRRNRFVAKFLTYRFGEAALCFTTLILSLYINLMLGCVIFYFTLYRGLLHLYLKRKYDTEYEGLLEGSDALWAIEDNSRGIVNGLMIIEFDANGDDFYAAMKRHVGDTLLRYTKFKCVRERSMGYLFFLNNRVRDDDVVKKMDLVGDGAAELSKDDLRKLLTTYCNAPLPHNDAATCEILIGTQSVRWRNNGSGKFQYPVLYRLHHCIGDGVALQNLIAKKMVDNYSGFLTENILNKIQDPGDDDAAATVQTKTLEKFVGSVKSIALHWYKQLDKILNMRAYQLSYLNPLEENAIHGPHLSGDKHFVLCVEDAPRYVSMVKDIKKKVDGATFSDVVLTAVARSFSEHFKKMKLETPPSISVALTIFPPNQDVKVLSSDHIDLTNRFSLGLIRLPMIESDGSSLKTLKYIKEDIESLKKGVDVILNYWQIKILFGVLPAPIVRYLVNKADSTMALSNFPGTDSLTILDGNKVLDFLFWIPNKSRVGLGMSIYTYDNRFQLGLLADKILIKRHEDAQAILDNVFKNIHKLNEHTRHKDNIIL